MSVSDSVFVVSVEVNFWCDTLKLNVCTVSMLFCRVLLTCDGWHVVVLWLVVRVVCLRICGSMFGYWGLCVRSERLFLYLGFIVFDCVWLLVCSCCGQVDCCC